VYQEVIDLIGNRSPRTVAIVSATFISLAIMILSLIGFLAPAESTGRVPLTFLEDIFGGLSQSLEGTTNELAEVRGLRQRNAELEQALVALQAEVAELREYRSDYDRLAALVNYTTREDFNYVAADVIGRDTSGLQAIHINRGTRNGVAVGDPVVNEGGLIGRVTQVSATGAEVLLITDPNSAVHSREQVTRDNGLVVGTLSGDLVFSFVDLDSEMRPGDLVVTSGETQAFPADIVIGQITGVSLTDDELFQEAAISSLVDFSRLEIVLVITNWEPIDLTFFEDEEQ
jgi:rod shape-determining protein MreC